MIHKNFAYHLFYVSLYSLLCRYHKFILFKVVGFTRDIECFSREKYSFFITNDQVLNMEDPFEVGSKVQTPRGIQGFVTFHGPMETSEGVFENMVALSPKNTDVKFFDPNIIYDEGENTIFMSAKEISEMEITYPVGTKIKSKDGMEGIVLFCEKIEVQMRTINRIKTVAGILLDQDYDGDSDGMFQGKRYFQVAENRAKFLLHYIIHVKEVSIHSLLVVKLFKRSFFQQAEAL